MRMAMVIIPYNVKGRSAQAILSFTLSFSPL